MPLDDLDEFVSRYTKRRASESASDAPLSSGPKLPRPVPAPLPFAPQTSAGIIGQARNVVAPMQGSERLAKMERIQQGLGELRAEGQQVNRLQAPNKMQRAILGLGEGVVRLGASAAALPARIGSLTTGQAYDPTTTDTANKLTGLAEYLGGMANPDDQVFSAGGLGQAGGQIVGMLAPGKVAGKLLPGASVVSTVGRGALSGALGTGAMEAGQPISNTELAQRSAGGAVGGATGDVIGNATAPITKKIRAKALRKAAELGEAAVAGSMGNVSQSAALGETDAAKLRHDAIAGAALGTVAQIASMGGTASRERADALREAQIRAQREYQLPAVSRGPSSPPMGKNKAGTAKPLIGIDAVRVYAQEKNVPLAEAKRRFKPKFTVTN